MRAINLLLVLPLAMGAGLAVAQSPSDLESLTAPASGTMQLADATDLPPRPEQGTLSTTHTQHSLSSTGVVTDSTETTYKHEDGTTTTDRKTTTLTPTVPGPTTTIIIR